MGGLGKGRSNACKGESARPSAWLCACLHLSASPPNPPSKTRPTTAQPVIMEAEEIRPPRREPGPLSVRHPQAQPQPNPPPPFLGVTPPLSLDQPSPADTAATERLERRMRALGSYETGEMCKARREVGGSYWSALSRQAVVE